MYVPPEEYVKSLPKKNIAAGALFFDEGGKILIVKPSYKDNWNIPGGVGNTGESPQDTCKREVQEEVGITKDYDLLLCVSQHFKPESGQDTLVFIFYGGILSKEEVQQIKIQDDEISEYAFKSEKEFTELVSERMAKRLPLCLEAIKDKKTRLI
jgi:ADP-ribose pyrophosphatase YjhB (NUDIX family)